jgi:hypothetical protein
MRIYSDFNDYYDGVQAHGQDPACGYIRKELTTEVNLSVLDIPTRTVQYGIGWSFFSELKYYVLGFCGQLYPFIEYGFGGSDDRTKVYYEPESLIKLLSKDKWFRSRHSDFNKAWIYKFGDRRHNKFKNSTIESIEAFFNFYTGAKSETFVNLGVPVFKIDAEKFTREMAFARYGQNKTVRILEIVTNPNLKKLDFGKIKDVYSAFQELEMFLSGVLGIQQPELVEIADKDMVVKKGFNDWSFRKQGVNSI